MAFRDDREALRAKASSLEEELEETREELEEAKKKLGERARARRASKAAALWWSVRGWFIGQRTTAMALGAVALVAIVGFIVFNSLQFGDPPPLPDILFVGEGHVMEVRGDSRIDADATCEVRIVPDDGGDYNCRVHVTCGERELYGSGAGGYTHCEIVDSEAVSADDMSFQDGDPALHFDREASRVLIQDAEWLVTVRFGERPPSTSGRASWRGVVERSVGVDVPIESECTITAEMRSDSYRQSRAALAIRCGDAELYRGDTTAPGIEWSVTEGPAPAEGSYEYMLRYEDDEGEPTRTFASIDSRERRARIWRDSPPSMFVELRVDDVSAPREGAALVSDNENKRAPFEEVMRAAARVANAGPNAPTTVDETCNFELRPAWSSAGHNCRIAVRCGRRYLYGGGPTGFTACTLVDGVPVAASTTDDGVPALRYQRDSGFVGLRSYDQSEPWIIELTLEPAAEDPDVLP